MPGFAHRLDAAAREFADRVVLHRGDAALTWAGLDARARATARLISGLGVAPGGRIALALDDPLDMAIGLIAGLKAGLAVAPLNARLADADRAAILAELGAAPVLERVAGEDEAGDFDTVDPGPEAGAIILFTSGSTGRPKGVELSHRATDAGMDIWIDSALMLRPDDVVIASLPLAHSFGLFGGLLSPLLIGAQSVLVPRFSPEAVVEAIARHRATVFPGVATMFRRLLDSGLLDPARIGSLRCGVSGAAPCPWELAREWREATGTPIARGYGMSELFRPIAWSPADLEQAPDSIGRALAGVEIKVVDDDGRALPPGETGELLIRTPSALTGYLNRPEETAAVLRDGWFLTGDLATIDAEGLVRIVGRKKEIILRGGYTIAAGEVEAALATHPDIAEVAVIGVPDRELGEDICAYVALKPGADLAPEALIAYGRERLSSHKYPRIVRLIDELPKGATGKIDKAQLAR